MITKFDVWDEVTQKFISESLVYIIDTSGYVVDIYDTSRRIDEDHIYDAIEMSKVYKIITRSDIIDTLTSLDNLPYETLFIIAHAIDYLKHNFDIHVNINRKELLKIEFIV